MPSFLWLASRDKEWGRLAANIDHAIDWEYCRPGSHPLSWPVELTLGGEGEVYTDEYTHYQITDLWLPVFDADAYTSIQGDDAAIKSALEALVDRRFGKMEGISPVSYTHLTLPTILLV